MPTNISNAVGTARQFTPQPDAFYQGRLSGLAAIQYSAAQFTNHALVAENLTKLTNAMQNFEFGNDKRQDELGLQRATDLINGSTAEDIMRLNVIDAAQQEGYMDVADNPYFKAHAERLRGEFLSTKARQAYDEKYAELPADSADAEVARYNEFSLKWRQENVKSLPMNQVAFDKGFNANGMVNQTMLAQEYTKKKIEEGRQVTYIETMAQLGKLKEDFPHMQKDELTAKVREVLSNPRLMGLDVATRAKLVNEFAQSMITTGAIDVERFLQMAQNVTVQTNMDGTRRTMYDLIDPQSFRVQGNLYQAQYYTKEADAFLSDYKNDVNMDRCLQDFESYDNYKQQRLGKYLPQIKSQQGALQAKKAVEAQKVAKKENIATGARLYLQANYKAYIDGMEYDGSPKKNRTGMPFVPNGEGGWRAPTEDEKMNFFKESEAYVMDYTKQPDMSEETRSRYWMKLYNYEPLRSIKQSYVHDYEQQLSGLSPESLQRDSEGSIVLPDKIKMFTAAYKHDSADFQNAFGDKMAQNLERITRYAEAAGSLAGGIEMLAQDNVLDPDLKRTYLNEVSTSIAQSGYNIEDMHTVGGGNTTTVWLGDNPSAALYVEDQAAFYRAHGYSTEGAIQAAIGGMKERMMYIHGALIPKTLFSNAGTTNDEYWSAGVLDEMIYTTAAEAGDVDNASEVNVVYNSRTSTFVFSYGGTVKYKTLQDIKKEAYDKAKTASERGDTVSTVTTADINAARNPYGIQEDSQEYAGMSALQMAGMVAPPSVTYHE